MFWTRLAVLAHALLLTRTYHQLRVADVPRTIWTHVCVTGLVSSVARERDGDVHFRVEDGAAFVMAEIIPAIPLAPPRVGQTVDVCGISRFDRLHRWTEIHPVEVLRLR